MNLLKNQTPRVKAVTLGDETHYVKRVNLSTYQAYQAKVMTYPKGVERDVAAVVWSVIYFACDQDGNPVYTADDYDALSEVGLALVALSDEALTHNRIDLLTVKKN